VGVSRQSIIAIEKSKYKPTIELALKLARALSCPVEELFWLQESQGGK
jgi:putative transcriptional regulator